MTVERVFEAAKGYWIATYACPVGDLGDEYIGYFKICTERPSGYFEASACVVKGCCEDRARGPEQSVEAAFAFAREQIANMPDAVFGRNRRGVVEARASR
jgi:hypothetical protein